MIVTLIVVCIVFMITQIIDCTASVHQLCFLQTAKKGSLESFTCQTKHAGTSADHVSLETNELIEFDMCKMCIFTLSSYEKIPLNSYIILPLMFNIVHDISP